MNILHLKSGRERSAERRHPWIFSGAVRAVDGAPAPGETVVVMTSRGDALGRAAPMQLSL